jgi:GDP-D-mannose 3',5'-epimerase
VNEPMGERVHVVGDLIGKAIRYPGDEFRIWGTGEQTRDFLYVSDCVEALLKLEEKTSNPPLTLNIGSGKATSIRELANQIIEISGKDIKPIYDPQRLTGPLSRTADTTKARATLGWQPKVSLDNGLRQTYPWIESVLKGKGNL